MEVHCGRMVDHLGYSVKTIVGTGPVQDPHLEQAKKDQVINVSLIDHSEPFCSLDHIGPEAIIKEEVWVYIPPPLIMDDHLII